MFKSADKVEFGLGIGIVSPRRGLWGFTENPPALQGSRRLFKFTINIE